MKKGSRKRPIIIAIMGLILSLLLLLEAGLIGHQKANLTSLVGLWSLFLIVLIATVFFIRRLRAGTVQIAREGLTIPLGLRPLFLPWKEIKEIREIAFRNAPYVGIKLKSLDEQRKAIQYLARLNEEHTGYHLVLDGGFFEEPPHTMAPLLATYAGDESARQDLPRKDEKP